MATDVIEKLWRKETGRQIADLGINISEGDASAMGILQRLLDRVADSYLPDDFGPTTTKDLMNYLKVHQTQTGGSLISLPYPDIFMGLDPASL